jgi:hypothetical protein
MNRILLGVIVSAAVALAGCGAASRVASTAAGSAAANHPSAAAAASSALANPTVRNDLNAGEQLLLSNLQANWDASHPGHSVTTAIHKTFPQGNTKAIVTFGLRHFTPAVVTTSGPGSPRDNWLQLVYGYALTQGGYTPSASPGAGTGPGTVPSPSRTGTGA